MGVCCGTSKNDENEENKKPNIEGVQKVETKIIKATTLKDNVEKGQINCDIRG